MSENEERHNKPDTPNVDQGAPKQAISGGGSETRAGSDAGGSASGDGAKVQSQDTEGGFKPGTGDRPSEGPRESPSFAPPDGDSASDADSKRAPPPRASTTPATRPSGARTTTSTPPPARPTADTCAAATHG